MNRSFVKRSLLAVAAAAALAWAAGSAVAQVLMSSTPVAKYWLRMYPFDSYSQIWHIALKVHSVKDSVPKALAALQKLGGEATVPLANMASSSGRVRTAYQQLAFRVPAAKGDAAVKGLEKLGDEQALDKNPGFNAAIIQEAKEKLDKLTSEREANKDALAKMPSVGAMTDEVMEHLSAVVRAHQEAEGRILLNIELVEAPPASAAPKKTK